MHSSTEQFCGKPYHLYLYLIRLTTLLNGAHLTASQADQLNRYHRSQGHREQGRDKYVKTACIRSCDSGG